MYDEYVLYFNSTANANDANDDITLTLHFNLTLLKDTHTYPITC